jgi:hypothetical protein
MARGDALVRGPVGAESSAGWRNLVGNFRWLWVLPWLQEATLPDVVALWQYAQRLKEQEEERLQQRLNDPDDLYGKSNAYVRAFYLQREDW